jgi:hypothetical protein
VSAVVSPAIAVIGAELSARPTRNAGGPQGAVQTISLIERLRHLADFILAGRQVESCGEFSLAMRAARERYQQPAQGVADARQ